ncbi:MAG: hypothetical protein WA459_24425 [Stellaceae bacterium]
MTVADLRNGLPATRALPRQQETPSPALGSEETGDPVLVDAQARFVVQVPRSTIDAFVRLRWLRVDQRHDLGAIMAALKRMGRAPDILRVT